MLHRAFAARKYPDSNYFLNDCNLHYVPSRKHSFQLPTHSHEILNEIKYFKTCVDTKIIVVNSNLTKIFYSIENHSKIYYLEVNKSS